MAIFEVFAGGCPAIAANLSTHNMCAWMVETFGSAAQRERRLPSLVSMDLLASYFSQSLVTSPMPRR